jgi:NADPH-dependent curcumin reductase CurA
MERSMPASVVSPRRSVVLRRRPSGAPDRSDFEIREDAVPSPGPGEVVTRTIWLSIDPYMRGRLREQQTYAKAIEIGEVMTGETVGEVVASGVQEFAVGEIVVGARGWQSHVLSKAAQLTKVQRPGEARQCPPISTYLGVLGMPGTTAYTGVTDILKPKAGETVVISAASGAVGSVAGQLAKRAGARVVGVAGGAEKCLYVQDSLMFDDCVDHRAMDLRAELAGGVPERHRLLLRECRRRRAGGGVRSAQSVRARGDVRHGVAIQPGPVPARPEPWLRGRQARADPGLHRVRQAGTFGRVAALAAPWVVDGSLQYREDEIDGLENAPDALGGILGGRNFGKLLVRVGPDPD